GLGLSLLQRRLGLSLGLTLPLLGDNARVAHEQQMADKVLVDTQRALDLYNSGRRHGEVEEEIQAVTMVLDRIGEAAASHRVHPNHLATVYRDRLGDALDDRSRLLVADVGVDDDAEFVVSCHLWHAVSSFGYAPTAGPRTRMCCAKRWGRMDGVGLLV